MTCSPGAAGLQGGERLLAQAGALEAAEARAAPLPRPSPPGPWASIVADYRCSSCTGLAL